MDAMRLSIKLESYGIVGNVLEWTRDFLKNRSQREKVERIISPCESKVCTLQLQLQLNDIILFRAWSYRM